MKEREACANAEAAEKDQLCDDFVNMKVNDIVFLASKVCGEVSQRRWHNVSFQQYLWHNPWFTEMFEVQ